MTHRTRRVHRLAAPILLSTLLAAACGGGDSDEASETTTTTEAVETTTTTVVETTTTEPAPPTYPLTGLAVTSTDTPHPALVVKIDNDEQARPQWGLNQADIVYEEVVEARITRFAAVFHSEEADPVGPIRSARTSDFDILEGLNTPLFANSGGNSNVMSMLSSVDMANANQSAFPDLYYREDTRRRPHNLLSNTSELIAAAPPEAGTPAPQFTYRAADDALPTSARVVSGVDIDYGGVEASYRWDPAVDGWARMQHDEPHVDADGTQIAPENLIVQFIDYGRSAADPRSPEALLLGEGTVWIFTDGHVIEGTWSREEPTDVTSYRTATGEEIALTPGKTWIALPRTGEDMALIIE